MFICCICLLSYHRSIIKTNYTAYMVSCTKTYNVQYLHRSACCSYIVQLLIMQLSCSAIEIFFYLWKSLSYFFYVIVTFCTLYKFETTCNLAWFCTRNVTIPLCHNLIYTCSVGNHRSPNTSRCVIWRVLISLYLSIWWLSFDWWVPRKVNQPTGYLVKHPLTSYIKNMFPTF